jgi:hypothetical protein
MDNPPRLFIPLQSKQSQEELYKSLRDYVQSTTGFAITDRRIYKLETEHHGAVNVGKSEIAVGKRLGEGGEIVVAIFEIKEWYVVCTQSRGAFMDSPVYVSGADVTLAVEFAH